MKLVLSVLFAFMLSAACGEQVKIHEVEAVVSEILVKADGYIHYKSNISEANGLSSLNKRASSYWYQNIAHQGISAFGPSGYVVYRNVMDYGATGNFNLPAFATCHTDSIQLVQGMASLMILPLSTMQYSLVAAVVKAVHPVPPLQL